MEEDGHRQQLIALRGIHVRDMVRQRRASSDVVAKSGYEQVQGSLRGGPLLGTSKLVHRGADGWMHRLPRPIEASAHFWHRNSSARHNTSALTIAQQRRTGKWKIMQRSECMLGQWQSSKPWVASSIFGYTTTPKSFRVHTVCDPALRRKHSQTDATPEHNRCNTSPSI